MLVENTKKNISKLLSAEFCIHISTLHNFWESTYLVKPCDAMISTVRGFESQVGSRAPATDIQLASLKPSCICHRDVMKGQYVNLDAIIYSKALSFARAVRGL